MLAALAFALMLAGQSTSSQAPAQPLAPRDAPAQKGNASIFPDDPQKWEASSRLIRTARPDNAGAFEFRHVIPGTYLAVPLEYVRDGEWADPEFLQNLRNRGTRVTVDKAGASDWR